MNIQEQGVQFRYSLLALESAADRLEPVLSRNPKRYGTLTQLPKTIRDLTRQSQLHRSQAGALAADANQHLQNTRVAIFQLLQPNDQGTTLADADLTLDLQEIGYHLSATRTHAHLMYSLLTQHEPDFLLRQPTPTRAKPHVSADNPAT